MSEQQSSYRQIFKATSLFGGVQVFNILIGIVRVKFVAVLLGTVGVGIIGLLNAPLQLIMSITGFGIAQSAVRDISEANGSGDQNKIAKSIIALRRCSWGTGLLGVVVTIIMAPQLSEWSFGNREYSWSFIWLSVTLLLQALSKGQNAILQGTRRLKDMAKSGVIGSFIGLVTSLPLYYYLGNDGIVIAMIITALTALILSWYFSRKVKVENIIVTKKETLSSGMSMAKLGVSMTLAGFITALSTYVLNAFISNIGGVEQVGLYSAGWGLVGQYTSLVFTAMATDYFPRLSAIQDNNNAVRDLVRQQSETALLIMTPLLTMLIVLMPIAIRVLYTEEFLPVVMFANLTVLGMHFKTVSWAMGYVYLAKGNGRLFLVIEIVAGGLMLALNLVLYYFYGINGLGVSFILSYVLAMIMSYFILNKKYDLIFPRIFFIKVLTTYLFVGLSFLTIFITNQYFRYGAGIIVLIVALIYSIYKLNEMMDLKSLILQRLKNR